MASMVLGMKILPALNLCKMPPAMTLTANAADSTMCVCSAPVTVYFRCSPLLCLLVSPKVDYQCSHTPRGARNVVQGGLR